MPFFFRKSHDAQCPSFVLVRNAHYLPVPHLWTAFAAIGSSRFLLAYCISLYHAWRPVLHSNDRRAFHSVRDLPHKLIGKRYNIACASVIVQQLILFALSRARNSSKILGTRAAELIDILVVIAYRNHAQIIIALNHRGTDKPVPFSIHVLCPSITSTAFVIRLISTSPFGKSSVTRPAQRSSASLEGFPAYGQPPSHTNGNVSDFGKAPPHFRLNHTDGECLRNSAAARSAKNKSLLIKAVSASHGIL